MERTPLITVITVCFNSGKTIKRTIDSVLNQTYKNYEYWIIDGASKDNTVSIIEEYAERFDGRLHYVSEPDQGLYDAMNKGIQYAKGEVIGILNSDDFYSEETLEKVAEKYAEEEYYPYLVISGDMIRVSEEDEEICHYHFSQELIDNKEFFGHPSMFVTKKLYERIGCFDLTFSLAADADFQCRVYEDPLAKRVLCPFPFNHMREGGATDQLKNRWIWFREVRDIRLKYQKGSKLSILVKGLIGVIRVDIKVLMPKAIHKYLYKLLYR